MTQTRLGLLAVFIGCLAVQLVALFSVSQKMWPEDFQSLVLKLIAIYSVHLSVILGAMFAQPKGSPQNPPGVLAWVAIVLASLWNMLLLWRSLSFVLAAQDSAPELLKYLDSVSSESSFLVTGMLAFFFVKQKEASSS